ncbi:riboflavin-binding protein-like isoform X1 [Scyliorhinus canicula]|uniref:riboflavin-binding protein-like isoform X1 n=1 Tax=Scyliorhinus canicula TaxID=7830 RepID=UPI0018F5D60A|nr:riboflavin-binding protein-like isoform X1 [Scyliorhinus canicula]XP_038650115.1 riboflavin-binding protein-like isoform X1 [Scyliorhinus canicula]
MMIMFLGISIATLILAVDCYGDSCLSGINHKAMPGPEPGMRACKLYSQSSCCFSNYTEQLAVSPVTKVQNTYWNRCGQLSSRCEEYMKKIDCFYHCSPHTFNWINPNNSHSVLAVPICQDFCDDWFTACRDDLTCTRNWISDWEWDDHGNNCRNECIPYHQMYKNGKDLCVNMWGATFKVISCPCHCLMMDDDDNSMIQYLIHQRGTPAPAEVLHREAMKAPFCQRRQTALLERRERAKTKKGMDQNHGTVPT